MVPLSTKSDCLIGTRNVEKVHGLGVGQNQQSLSVPRHFLRRNWVGEDVARSKLLRIQIVQIEFFRVPLHGNYSGGCHNQRSYPKEMALLLPGGQGERQDLILAGGDHDPITV